ncbi:hypothetical protein D3C78_1662470 [compost metagenome]
MAVNRPGLSSPRAQQYRNKDKAPKTQRKNTTFQALWPDSMTKTPSVPDRVMAAAICARPRRSDAEFMWVLRAVDPRCTMEKLSQADQGGYMIIRW